MAETDLRKRRWAHARERTGWFSLKFDVLPGIVADGVTAATAIRVGSGDQGFAADSVVMPFVFGVVALIAYWLIANGVEFAWNYWRSGDRLGLADRDAEIETLTSRLA